jgi:hypothetical protein
VSPSLFYTRASHNLGKALGEGLGLLCAPFTSLSLSHSLSLFHFFSLSLLSLPPSLYLSLYLSLSLSLLSIILFGVSNGRFRPCYCNDMCNRHLIICINKDNFSKQKNTQRCINTSIDYVMRLLRSMNIFQLFGYASIPIIPTFSAS